MGRYRPTFFSTLVALVGYSALNALMPRSATTPLATTPNDAGFVGRGSSTEPLVAHHARAAETERGREAQQPEQIPWRGWKDILWRTYQQFQEDRLLAIAAGVVFFGILALFPAVTAMVSTYGLFAKTSTIQGHLSFLSAVMPEGAVSIVDEQIARIVAKGDVKLGLGFVFGLGVALWSANAGTKAIIDALNVVYEETEKRGFFKLNFISLSFTLGAVGAVLVAVGTVVVLPLLLTWLRLGPVSQLLIEFGRWPALAVAVLFTISVLYRYGPSRVKAKWRWLSVGSVVATAIWIAGSAIFSYYMKNYADYGATYGSLGAAIGMMMWMWMSAIVVLLGAELNSEIEHQTAVDTTIGMPKPIGSRGAVMADTVGEAQG